jgi:hypothetical protein
MAGLLLHGGLPPFSGPAWHVAAHWFEFAAGMTIAVLAGALGWYVFGGLGGAKERAPRERGD